MKLYLREQGPALPPRPLWSYREAGDYLAWAKAAFQVCRRGGTVRLSWAGPALDLNAFRREFRGALHRRIALKGGARREAAWRKLDPRYQLEQGRDARRVNAYSASRIVDPINRLATPELQRRFRWRYTADGLEITLANPARRRLRCAA